MQKQRKPYHRTHLGEHFTEGARQIWLRLEARDVTPSAFVASVGWDRGSLFKYMHGDQKPDRTRSLILQSELGIDPADFDREPAKRFALPKKAA